MRLPSHRYEDPLDRIWVTCAARIGLRMGRAPDVYAATDGKGSLTLSTDDGFDADDSIAQMIYHELCHSLIEGAASFDEPDWGLDNFTARDLEREHACIRLQATINRQYGLRGFFAPTTVFREYSDALPEDALLGDSDIVRSARRAAARVGRAPWGPHFEEALAATAAVLAATRDYGDGPPVADARALLEGASQPGAALPSLHALIESPAPTHPRSRLPLAVGDRAKELCGGCAWLGPNALCRQTEERRRTRATEPACERWEAALDCQTCGACCREAFGAVPVRADDVVVTAHVALVVVESDGFRSMRRVPERSAFGSPDDTRCVALAGVGTPERLYTCDVYEDRPKNCRDFTLGSANCLSARRRVGLSR